MNPANGSLASGWTSVSLPVRRSVAGVAAMSRGEGKYSATASASGWTACAGAIPTSRELALDRKPTNLAFQEVQGDFLAFEIEVRDLVRVVGDLCDQLLAGAFGGLA